MTNVTYNRWRGWFQRYPPSLSSSWFQGNANFFKISFPYHACLLRVLTNIEEKLFFKVSTFLAVFGFHFYSKDLVTFAIVVITSSFQETYTMFFSFFPRNVGVNFYFIFLVFAQIQFQ